MSRLSRHSLWLLLLAALSTSCVTTTKSSSARTRTKQLTATATPKRSAPKVEYQDSKTTLATYGVTRRVAMFYTLDLYKDNAHSPALASIFQTSEEAIRECYTDRLDKAPQLRGEMTFAFKIPVKSGRIEKIARVKGGVKDKVLERCIKQRLAQTPFPAPRDLIGTVSYKFDYTQDVSTPVLARR